MSFSKKVDNIIYDLKDINKMYFYLQNKNKNLSMKLIRSEEKSGDNLNRPIGYGTGENLVDTRDFPAAGVRGSNTNSSHNLWTTSLRRL